MKYKTIILPFAKQDIREAAIWYNSKQGGLGKRFSILIREKIEFLKQDPYSTTIRFDETRTAVLDIFPFMIHYLINEFEKTIIITAIIHTSRNADLWKTDRENPDSDE